jgi:hypothetical protein
MFQLGIYIIIYTMYEGVGGQNLGNSIYKRRVSIFYESVQRQEYEQFIRTI